MKLSGLRGDSRERLTKKQVDIFRLSCDFLILKRGSFVMEKLSTQDKIDFLFDNFKEFLKEKNKRYGDSALKPLKTFSKIDSGSQLCNRIDDKLGRISNSSELKKNDVSDLFGYLALLLIEKQWLTFEEFLD